MHGIVATLIFVFMLYLWISLIKLKRIAAIFFLLFFEVHASGEVDGGEFVDSGGHDDDDRKWRPNSGL